MCGLPFALVIEISHGSFFLGDLRRFQIWWQNLPCLHWHSLFYFEKGFGGDSEASVLRNPSCEDFIRGLSFVMKMLDIM